MYMHTIGVRQLDEPGLPAYAYVMRILITGSSKGLGRATATELAHRGHHVISTARKLEALADLDVAQRLALDVTDDASVRAAVAAAGQIDALINNAGEIVIAPLESVPFEEVKRLYDINVFGTLRMIQAVAPQMRERGAGTIANISSVVGHMSLPLTGIYCSTKWAIEALSETLRVEIGHFGVRVILVEPGQIGTGALDNPPRYFTANDPYLPLATGQTQKPREQMTPPAEIARVVADAIEAKTEQFRWPAGADAIAMIGARKKLGDAEFEAEMKKYRGVTW